MRRLVFRHDFAYGTGYGALFMHEGDLLMAPLAPINEEVAGASDAWVEWVRSRI